MERDLPTRRWRDRPAAIGAFVVVTILALTGPVAAGAAFAQIDPAQAYRCERAYANRDFASARALCRPLADAGLADAQFVLGQMYQNGEGVARDAGRAAPWYRRAALQGHAGAAFALGMLYRYGIGVARDPVEAYAWFTRAAEAGNGEAAQARELVARDLSPAQVADARTRASRYAASTRSASEPPTTSASKPGWAPPPGPELVADVQRGLARLGYDPGPPDGVAGEKTRRAIRRFQAQAGLPVDGKVTQALKTAIDRAILAATETSTPAPHPSSSAFGRPADSRAQALVDALRGIIDRAERTRAADPAIIDSLRALVRQYDWPWRTTVFDDDFGDGDFTRDPTWRTAGGQFRAYAGRGLRTRYIPPARRSQSKAQADPAAEILGAILGQIAGAQGRSGERESAPAGEGVAFVETPISNAFAVVFDLTVLEARADGGLRLGPYRGTGRAAGYRLALVPGAQSVVELLRVAPGRSAVIERRALSTRLDDGRRHRIEWRRGRDGEMVVLIDQTEVLRAVDRRYADRFAGFTVVNRGGDYMIGRVAVYGAGS